MTEPRVEVEEPDRSATPSRPAAITLGRVTCCVAGDFLLSTLTLAPQPYLSDGDVACQDVERIPQLLQAPSETCDGVGETFPGRERLIHDGAKRKRCGIV